LSQLATNPAHHPAGQLDSARDAGGWGSASARPAAAWRCGVV